MIGTEVPTPGGAVDEMELSDKAPEAAERALPLHREAFSQRGLKRAGFTGNPIFSPLARDNEIPVLLQRLFYRRQQKANG